MPAHGLVHADSPTMGETHQDTHRRTLQTRNLMSMPRRRQLLSGYCDNRVGGARHGAKDNTEVRGKSSFLATSFMLGTTRSKPLDRIRRYTKAVRIGAARPE